MQLDELVRKNELIFYAAVYHFKEEDEKKDHIHVYMVPDGQLDTSHVTDVLTEYDMKNEKPIKPLPYAFSKFGDWYLYTSHNIAYLRSKGQTRKYHYSIDDFFSSNDDYLIELVHTIDMSKINQTEIIIRAVDEGISFNQLVKDGRVPVQLIGQYRQVFNEIAYGAYDTLDNHTRRGGYLPHVEGKNEDDKT